MGLAISFPAPETSRTLAAAVTDSMNHASTLGRFPMLVIRVPELERIAWRMGKRTAQRAERAAARAFYAAVQSSVRRQDVLGHDVRSDLFVVTMLAPGRNNKRPLGGDCRRVLRRVVATMSSACGMNTESGWVYIRADKAGASLASEISAALERGRRELERYDFLATVGHEMRTPLTSIRGYLETLLQTDYDASTSRNFLETARGEALRLGRLVDGMFEFSQLDLCADHLCKEKCDVPLAIRRTSDIIAPAAAYRSVQIALDTEPGIAAMETDACIQTLVNIVDNAIRHGREGGRIAISSDFQDGFVRITVDDDGTGVCEPEREAIFAFRVRGSAAHPQGTGIGLTIARKLVERAGGEIRVGDSPLGGARFELFLPAQAE